MDRSLVLGGESGALVSSCIRLDGLEGKLRVLVNIHDRDGVLEGMGKGRSVVGTVFHEVGKGYSVVGKVFHEVGKGHSVVGKVFHGVGTILLGNSHLEVFHNDLFVLVARICYRNIPIQLLECILKT